MAGWTPERILDAAAAWVWVPEEADQVRTDDYHLIAYPAGYTVPTQVAWCRSERPAAELLAEVAAHVRRWRRNRVSWWVCDATRPPDLERALQGDGAALDETVEILAYDLAGGPPRLDTPADVVTEVVHDERTVRARHVVSGEVWRSPEPTEEQVLREAVRAREDLASSGFQVVAFVAGEPVASGGCTLADDVARLWGAATRPAYRGRGAYRAVLAHRLVLAHERGATLGLVKGRVETSGPILRRAGFTAHGEERCYTLPVGLG